jgi:predicted GTPase
MTDKKSDHSKCILFSFIKKLTGRNIVHLANRNIVVFGQTGTGKSSLINMLAGKSVAGVSDGATGCTPSNLSYLIPHGADNYTFWDTAGLNEDRFGTVSSRAAIRNLLDLVKNIGVNLLIYCIRGRLVDIIRVNYDLFWRIICQKRVPVVLVVTGLELENDMDDWWRSHQNALRKMKMSFAGHACITATRGRRGIFEKEYEASAKKVWKLVDESCRLDPCFMTPEWPAQAQAMMEKYMETYNSDSPKAWLRRLFLKPSSVRRQLL